MPPWRTNFILQFRASDETRYRWHAEAATLSLHPFALSFINVRPPVHLRKSGGQCSWRHEAIKEYLLSMRKRAHALAMGAK